MPRTSPASKQRRLREAERGREILDPAVAEVVLLFGERGFHHVGRAGDDRAARVVDGVADEVRDVREDREEDRVEGALLVLVEKELVEVRLSDLRRIARIDRAVLAALGEHLLGARVTEDDVLRTNSEHLEVGPEKRAQSSTC